jgi:hypothetical protein
VTGGKIHDLARRASDWAEDASCKGMADETFAADDPFFPELRGHPSDRDAYAAGKAICGSCPVQPECLADAMANEPVLTRSGLRGGLTGAEREALHRKATRKPVERQPKPEVPECRNGHVRTPENTTIRSNGRYRCRDCIEAQYVRDALERQRLRDAGVVKRGGPRDQSWRERVTA